MPKDPYGVLIGIFSLLELDFFLTEYVPSLNFLVRFLAPPGEDNLPFKSILTPLISSKPDT